MPGQVQGWAGWGQSCACAAGGFGKQHLLPALEGLLGQHCTLSPTGICCFAFHLFPFVLETKGGFKFPGIPGFVKVYFSLCSKTGYSEFIALFEL